MDAKTTSFFSSLNAECKEKFGKSLIKTEKDELVTMLKSLVNSNKITDRQRKKIRFGLINGLFGKESHQTPNPKVEKEIKKFMDTKIEIALRDGIIPPPDINEYERISDKFRHNHK